MGCSFRACGRPAQGCSSYCLLVAGFLFKCSNFILFLFKKCLFLRERERERESEQGRGRERGGQRIRSRLCADSRQADVGLELMTPRSRVACSWGTWVAQSVRRPHFSSGHDLEVSEFEPRIRPCADSSEPGACFRFCISLSLCPSPARSLSLSVSQK